MLASMPALLSGKTSAKLIADQAFTLAFPPDGDWADVNSWMVPPLYGVIPQFDLEIWSNAAVNLTDAELFGGSLHPFVIADDTFTPSHDSLDIDTVTANCDTVVEEVAPGEQPTTLSFVADGAGVGTLDESAYPAIVFHYATTVTTNANFETAVTASVHLRVLAASGAPATALVAVVDAFGATALTGGVTNALDAVGHTLLTGDGPVRLTTTTTLPAGLQLATNYWTIKLTNDTFALATSLSNAMAGTAVAITADDGAGVHTLSDTTDTARLHWHSEGLLGVAGDGAVPLTAQKAYRTRREHRPRALFYALIASLSTSDPEWVSAAVYPVQEV